MLKYLCKDTSGSELCKKIQFWLRSALCGCLPGGKQCGNAFSVFSAATMPKVGKQQKLYNNKEDF